MEEKIEQAYLYDFYGELLNEHQRRIYEDFVFNDLSLGEIANEEGISRQGVHDMIKRCTKSLEGYEEKLHLIAKFQSAKQKVAQIDALAKEFHSSHNEAIMEEIVGSEMCIRDRSKGRLTEDDVKAALKEVKMALLEADVNFKVVKQFVKDVQERAIGQDVMNGLNPGQMVIKIVNEEMVKLMGSETTEIKLQPGKALTLSLIHI